MALCPIAQRFGRPGTPTDQAWIESFNGHLKGEYPHLLAITDPATLRIARPVTPKMSLATTDSLTPASSSSFSTRCFSAGPSTPYFSTA